MNILFEVLIQGILLLAMAPLVNGIIKKVKAFLQCRKGPGIFQGYFDLWKYFQKEWVMADHVSWVFRLNPPIVWGALLTAGMLLPLYKQSAPFNFMGDTILFIYCLGLVRFFQVLSALDTGSAFGGMGGSREMAFAVVTEPALIAGLFAFALNAQTFDASHMSTAFLHTTLENFGPHYFLLLAAFFIIAVTETGRIPVDNPDTHLELTMVHEGMLLEYSGPALALLTWGAAIKQTLILLLFVDLFLPWGLSLNPALAFLMTFIKIIAVGIALGITETLLAKMRLFRVPKLLGTSFLLSVLAVIAQLSLK